eukprot:320552-Chlamydomonas_euryale.AAC.15
MEHTQPWDTQTQPWDTQTQSWQAVIARLTASRKESPSVACSYPWCSSSRLRTRPWWIAIASPIVSWSRHSHSTVDSMMSVTKRVVDGPGVSVPLSWWCLRRM